MESKKCIQFLKQVNTFHCSMVSKIFNTNIFDKLEPRKHSQLIIIMTKRPFKNKQISEAIKLIQREFSLLPPEISETPATLPQKLHSILLHKDQALQNQVKLHQQTINQNLTSRTYNWSLQDQWTAHLVHLHQIENIDVEDLPIEEPKVFVRLVQLKNQKVQQLEHLKYKYDRLLGEFRKLADENGRLKDQIEGIKNQYANAQIQSGKKDQQIQRLKQELQKLRLKFSEFQQIAKNIKNQNLDLRQFIVSRLKIVQQEFINNISLTVFQYNQFKTFSEEQFKKIMAAKDQIQKMANSKLEQKELIINQLVFDLGEAIGFRKKQQQSSDVWLAKYRQLKESKSRIQRQLNYKVNAMHPKENTGKYRQELDKIKEFKRKHNI